MDSFNLSEDIKVVCVTAKHFPEDVERAHIQLHAMLPKKKKGAFWNLKNQRARTDCLQSRRRPHRTRRSQKYGLEMFTIKKGTFNSFISRTLWKTQAASAKRSRYCSGNQKSIRWVTAWNGILVRTMSSAVPLDEKQSHLRALPPSNGLPILLATDPRN
jgi:hypothetical protein